MKTSLALVHHANQYLITEGYDNREGIAAVIGSPKSGTGLAAIIDLHVRCKIPFNLHISGTLLEAIAWHHPKFLRDLRRAIATGLVELIGSSYGQNIMRFFGYDYNRKQLNEELWLYSTHLGVPPESVRTFWPPERVWETRRMAPVLRDARLRNNGYRFVILDDRLLFSPKDELLPRDHYDESSPWSPEAYRMHEVEDGLGLRVFPIATQLRRSIPPSHEQDLQQIRTELEAMLVYNESNPQPGLLAVYADDMEKVSGIGEWGTEGPAKYRAFLDWIRKNGWIEPVLLTEWARRNETAGVRRIETGTFAELAKEFDAGEGYERWYNAPDWAPYRKYFEFAESRMREVEQSGGDRSLLKLAQKQLLVGNWETAWHTPSTGPHGDPNQHGHASPWARALTSHSRHAAVIAEAAWWMVHKDAGVHAETRDVDGDGEDEAIVKNANLYGVVTPRWGGRLVALFSVTGERGAMVIGNPCDDWNWMEELNRYMEVPRNHPGALTDVGFENDRYETEIVPHEGGVRVRLTNNEAGSAARGLVKEIILTPASCSLSVRYLLPRKLRKLTVESGLSPDYLGLLRKGSAELGDIHRRSVRGVSHDRVQVWVRIKPEQGSEWTNPRQEMFGHGKTVAFTANAREFTVDVGVTRLSGANSAMRQELSERLRREAV